MFCGSLAAQQDRWNGKEITADMLFNMSLFHQREETLFVGCPSDAAFSILIEQLLGRSQERLVNVLHVANFTEEVRQIIPL